MKSIFFAVTVALVLSCLSAQADIDFSAQGLKDHLQRKNQKFKKFWQEERYQQAVQVLEEIQEILRAVDAEDSQPGFTRVLAMGYARTGQKEQALAYLREVADLGKIPLEWVLPDSAFDSLREEPEFKEIVARDAASKKFWGKAYFATPYRENLSEDEKIAGLSRFWMEAKYNFAFFARIPDVDWDARYFTYLPKVRATDLPP